MLRSLYSGVSGMRAHQVRMDVIGNNVANVNTIGFKAGRVNFTDMLYQNIRNDNTQIGLGVKTGSIDTMFMQGAVESTERLTDFAIVGDSFFVLRDADNINTYYTRDGNFSINKDGYLIHTATGLYVQGRETDAPLSGNLASLGGTNLELTDLVKIRMIDPDETEVPGKKLVTFNVAKDGTITGLFEDIAGGNAQHLVIGKMELAAFKYVEGLNKLGDNLYKPSITSGDPMLGLNDSNIEIGYLELSNVDLTREFANMIITQRGFQANSRSVTTSDTMLEELLMLKR